jgi:hypothetical protein
VEDDDFMAEDDAQDWLDEEPSFTTPAPQAAPQTTPAGAKPKKKTAKQTAALTPASPSHDSGQDANTPSEPTEPPSVEQIATGVEPAVKPSAAVVSGTSHESKREPIREPMPEKPSAAANGAYKRPASPYRVPPKQFGPLSDRVIKSKTEENNTTAAESLAKRLPAGKDDD